MNPSRTISSESPETDGLVDYFDDPITAVWNLDEEVVRLASKESADGQLPTWLTSISESECNRILGITASNESRVRKTMQVLDIVSECQTMPADICRDKSMLLKITHRIVDEEETRALLRKWMSRHSTEQKEATRVFIKGPGIFRKQEQKLLTKPLLRRIVSGHYPNEPKGKRTLTDIGTWDGQMSLLLEPHFSKVNAIEPDEERYNMLLRATASKGKITPIQQDISDFVGGNVALESDAFLMSHVMYFLKYEKDLELIEWTLENMRPNGIGIIVLNDVVPEHGSREHLRRTFGNRSADYDPRKYAEFFDRKKIGYRITRSAMKITANGEDALVALREILQLQIAGDARNSNPEKLEQYVQSLKTPEGTHEYIHRIATVSYGPDFEQSDDLAKLNGEYARTSMQDTHRKITKVIAAPASNHKVAPRSVDPETTITWHPFAKGIQNETPAKVLEFFDRLDVATSGGMDDVELNRILAMVGIPRTLYLNLSRVRREIELAQAHGATNIVDLCTTISKADRRYGKNGTQKKTQAPRPKRTPASPVYRNGSNGHHDSQRGNPFAWVNREIPVMPTPKADYSPPPREEIEDEEPVDEIEEFTPPAEPKIVQPVINETPEVDSSLIERHADMLQQLEALRDEIRSLISQIASTNSQS